MLRNPVQASVTQPPKTTQREKKLVRVKKAVRRENASNAS